jgi:hypothetical protein
MAFIYDLSDTWDSAGITFSGIKLNVTDTGSAADSRLIDLRLNGASKFTVSKTGALTATGIVESTVGGFKFPDGTTQTTAASGSGGGVTSVSGTGTVSGITLTGTVTSSGSLTLGGTLSVTPSNFASQTANTFLAGPNGTSGTPTFRAIVAADIPTLNQNTTGSAATLTTARTIAMTGDMAWTSAPFDGSGNVTGSATLATVNPNVGTFGSATIIPVVTVNGKGLVTGVTTVAVSGGGGGSTPADNAAQESFVRTTSGADQTLPTGVLTILDYDTTTTNNNTANYTVGSTGRITVAEAGIYDITTGVVIEASSVSAASSTALGLFVNGEVVAIDTTETTLAVSEQRGHSISTQIALAAGDIVDARALVVSVGGVANGTARRLGTLLGQTATQVNHLSIAKCATADTVTSVSGTGSVNGITLTGTVTSSGSLTLGGTLSGVSLTSQVTGTLPVSSGGTGGGTAAAARTSLGAAASGANTDITSLKQDVVIAATGTIAADSIGFRGLPQNAQTGAYTLALSDVGKHISITTGGVVIPANASVAFPVGATIVVFNNSGSTQAISITSDTLRQAGTANTGTRTLAQYGLATLVKVTATVWAVTGNVT